MILCFTSVTIGTNLVLVAAEISYDSIHARHEDSIVTITERVAHILSAESDKISDDLSSTTSFVNVKEKTKEIHEMLKQVLNANPYYKDFDDKLNDLIESHPFFSDSS